MPETTQTVAAALDEIREHHRKHVSENYPEPGICVSRCAWRVRGSGYACHAGQLVAALDAVLELHQPGRFIARGSPCKTHEGHTYFSITAAEAEDVRACPDCRATVDISCTCGQMYPCADIQAISRALLGEDGGQ